MLVKWCNLGYEHATWEVPISPRRTPPLVCFPFGIAVLSVHAACCPNHAILHCCVDLHTLACMSEHASSEVPIHLITLDD